MNGHFDNRNFVKVGLTKDYCNLYSKDRHLKVRLWPELAGKGRYFDFGASFIPASIESVKEVSPLYTTLSRDGWSVRTVEHLLSALEGTGVDNYRIEIVSSHHNDTAAEVPIFDRSAREWVEAIEQVGLTVAMDSMAEVINAFDYICNVISVAIIDFSKLNGEEKAKTMAQIANGWGFFELVNHGIPEELLEIVKKVSSQCYKTGREEEFFEGITRQEKQ
ncbi:probable UDP-3-O-acyl-N-acetylglucosamine deacetylase 2, mitochondrial isoform X1 [Tanacetum coccineum]